jgi:hypothetical protein
MVLSEKEKIIQQFSEKIAQLPDEDFLTVMKIAFLFWNKNTHSQETNQGLELEKMIWTNITHNIEKIESNKSKPISNESIFGCMKGGIVYMSADFDEPLDDFKDYM